MWCFNRKLKFCSPYNGAKKCKTFFFQLFKVYFSSPIQTTALFSFISFLKKEKKKDVRAEFRSRVIAVVIVCANGACHTMMPHRIPFQFSDPHRIYSNVDPCDAVDQSERSIAASANAFISNRYPVNIAFVFRGSWLWYSMKFHNSCEIVKKNVYTLYWL